MEFKEEEVIQILKLIENSSFDFLQLEWGELRLTVAKSGYPIGVANQPSATSTQPAPAEGPAARTKAPEAVVPEGAVPIKAPMVGTFYRAPEPGAPPFVEAGAAVQADTTVGLIEVMKVFSAVNAGVPGTILEVSVQNGQFVEYGQTLFLLRPEEG